MQVINIYTNNEECTYCIKAKDLLESKKIAYNYNVITTEELKDKFPEAVSVPQIINIEGKLIGGFTELKATFATRTMFNTENTGHLTGEYPLFFGEQLGFADTINTPYPILDELYQTQMSQIWNEFEIDLTQDRQDMLNVARPKVDLMVFNLLWQTLVDAIASRSITGLLMQYVTNSDLEALYNAIALFETIHNRTYTHIMKQTFTDPNQALVDGYANENVVKRAKSIMKAFDAVANLPKDAEEYEIKEAVYLSIIALYLLESVNFMNSFAVTFGIAETRVFQGISQNVTLICRDELLHAKAGREILKISNKELKPFRHKVQALFDSVIAEEKEWNSYLFSEGRECIGINAPLMDSYVDYLAKPVAALLDLKETPDGANLPYMESYTNSSKVQVAAQELQLTSYLVNPLKTASADVVADTLKDLQLEFGE